jgi:hypothetical protein
MHRTSPTLVLIAAAAVTACGTLKPPKAQFPTVSTDPVVFALNGGPAGSLAGLNFLTGTSVPVDARFTFNLALDIDSAGRIVIYPAARVANGLTGTISVGLQPVDGAYEDYTEARKTGYTFDSTLVVPVGQVVGVNVLDQTTCTVYSLGASYFAKFVVDSVHPGDRAIFTRLVSDPNCGYVALTPGIPTK